MRSIEAAPSTAVVIAVGSELLTPHKTDTNSLFLTEQLNAVGIAVVEKMVVADDETRLAAAVRHGLETARLVVLTGGLGPTADDITRDVVAAVLGRRLEVDLSILDAIRARFAARGLVMPEVNRRQAEVPHGAEVIENRRGTAPGLWLRDPPSTVVLLPGPPGELRPMFEAIVAARLAAPAAGRRVYRRVVRTVGQTESYVDERAKPLYLAWRRGRVPIETTILASLGQIDLHLSAISACRSAAGTALDAAVGTLCEALGSLVVSVDGRSLPAVVGDLLTGRGATLGVAESCTGGLVTSRLTDVPGSSGYVSGGWIVYSNEAKIELLGVDPGLIAAHGAVSEPVAEAMAAAGRVRLNADFGLGVTGIAGPGGGTPEKPVGTVWVALSERSGHQRTRRFALPGDRERIKFHASQVALDLLRRALLRASAPAS